MLMTVYPLNDAAMLWRPQFLMLQSLASYTASGGIFKKEKDFTKCIYMGENKA